MRLFLTVNMDHEIKQEIGSFVDNLKGSVKGGKWVPKENLHITMLFLGEVEEKNLPAIDEAMAKAVSGIVSFPLYVDGLGAFPNLSKPNILWAGVKGDVTALNKVYQQTLYAIKEAGLPFDAKPKFTPHITLARKVIEVTNLEETFRTNEWTISSLDLYESTFVQDGVRYKRILTKNFY